MDRSAPPGWHDDGTGVTRWWDGERWTDRTREVDEQRRASRRRLRIFVVAGVVGVLLFGVPGLGRSSGIGVLDLALTLASVVAVISLLVGVAGYALSAGRKG